MDKKEKNMNEKYGEFICSEFNWVEPDKQKKIADKLDKATKKKSKR